MSGCITRMNSLPASFLVLRFLSTLLAVFLLYWQVVCSTLSRGEWNGFRGYWNNQAHSFALQLYPIAKVHDNSSKNVISVKICPSTGKAV